jgi:putative FmdB family regulatory protein
MPAYDYRCTKCERLFEVSRPMGATSDESCPECGAPAKRVFTPVGVAFKGNGFHNTDYKRRSAEKGEPAPSACPAKKDGSPSCSGCPAATE